MTGAVDDLVGLTQQMGPFLGAALSVYGAGVLDKAAEQTATAAVGSSAELGRRIFRLLSGKGDRFDQAVDAAVRRALSELTEPDTMDGLLLDLRRLLRNQPELTGEIAALIGKTGGKLTIDASGDRSVAAHTISGSVVITGEGRSR